MRRNSDPDYQHLEEADLSSLKQTSLCDWCLELPELITSLLDPYSFGGPEIEDRLTGLHSVASLNHTPLIRAKEMVRCREISRLGRLLMYSKYREQDIKRLKSSLGRGGFQITEC